MRPDPEIFMSFRFAVYLPDRAISVGATRVYTDPFTGALWIGSAHKTYDKTLAQLFGETKACEILMFTRGAWTQERDKPKNVRVRKIKVTWDTMRWVPFDLDATNAEVALDYVCLEGATYHGVEDVDAETLPPSYFQTK